MRRTKSVVQLSALNSLNSGTGFNPQKKTSTWNFKSQTNPKALLFEVDEARTVAAYKYLNALADDTKVANSDALANLRKHRQSEYFRILKERIGRNEKLALSEYMYYALTTNDVNKLQIELLEALKIHREHHGFLANLKILIVLRKWQTEKDENKKLTLNNKLRRKLNARGYASGYGKVHCSNILNLNGANLRGADLHTSSLDYTDLENADLSNCIIQNTHLSHSCLNRSNFSNSRSYNKSKQFYETCLNMNNSEAVEANFSGFIASELSAINTDFTGSSFCNANICLYPLRDTDTNKDTKFDYADFSNAKIKFNHDPVAVSYSIQHAVMHLVTLSGTNYSNIDFTNSQFLRFTAFYSCVTVKNELDSIYNNIFIPAIKEFDKISYQVPNDKRIEIAQQVIASALIYQINYQRLHKNEKVELLNLALQHKIFTIQQRTESYYASTMRFFYDANSSIFGSTPADVNPGIKLLRAELDKLAKSDAIQPFLAVRK
ncbi:MAG TPA: pentapeptide repeat-containing protein [Gammaproteobacteria bacterium]|nr:pentapeptide repeat-containing protein [Gammaproteobacteria bacterium]